MVNSLRWGIVDSSRARGGTSYYFNGLECFAADYDFGIENIRWYGVPMMDRKMVRFASAIRNGRATAREEGGISLFIYSPDWRGSIVQAVEFEELRRIVPQLREKVCRPKYRVWALPEWLNALKSVRPTLDLDRVLPREAGEQEGRSTLPRLPRHVSRTQQDSMKFAPALRMGLVDATGAGSRTLYYFHEVPVSRAITCQGWRKRIGIICRRWTSIFRNSSEIFLIARANQR